MSGPAGFASVFARATLVLELAKGAHKSWPQLRRGGDGRRAKRRSVPFARRVGIPVEGWGKGGKGRGFEDFGAI